MTFLEICKKVADAVGLHGSLTTVASSQTIQRDIAQAVSDSWVDIQKSREAAIFMNKTIPLTTVASQSSYDLNTEVVAGGNVSNIEEIVYDRRNLRKMLPTEIPYLDDNTPGKPIWWYLDTDYTITGDSRSLVFNSLDSDTYDLTVVYRKQIQRLPLTTAGNNEVPLIDEYHHYIIVYKAIMRMALQLQRVDLYDQYRGSYDEHWGSLMRDQNPKKRMRNRRFI